MNFCRIIISRSKKHILLILLLLINSCSHLTSSIAPTFSFLWINERHELEAILPPSYDASTSVSLTVENFKKHYQLKDDQGNHLSIVRLRYSGSNRVQLISGQLLDLSRNYYLLPIGGSKLYAYPSRQYLNKYYYFKNHLGAKKEDHRWTLTLWSPTATDVVVRIYRADDQRRLVMKLPLTATKPGLWEISIDELKFEGKKLSGYHYQYEIFALGEKRFSPDPYSFALATNWKKTSHEIKSTFVDIEELKKKYILHRYRQNKDLLSKNKQFIGHETNIRDLTIAPESLASQEQKGTYTGVLSAIPQFKKLGITHLQLMPLAFFPTVEEKATAYQSFLTPYNQLNYNWGYDTQHFFAPSGFYSQVPQSAQKKMEELKEMVNTLHQNDIGVILDIVFNHLYDGESFENAAPGCYLRRDQSGVISKKSGAGYSVESRNFMTRRMIIDAVEFWHRFYGINGFRFDLMSFIDRETLLHIRKRLGPDVILYGEGWNFTDLPKAEASTMHNLPDSTFGAFNGEARDSIIGSQHRPGVVLGNSELIPQVKSVIIGALKNAPRHYTGLSQDSFHHFTTRADQNIIYLDIHDGPTLWDKVDALSALPQDQRILRIKQAYAVLLTGLGRPIFQAGSEMGRSKKSIGTGKKGDQEVSTIFTGKENANLPLQANSYRHWDETNSFPWKNLNKEKDITSYLSKVIKLRQALPHLHYTSEDDIFRHVQFLDAHRDTNKKDKKKDSVSAYQAFSQLEDLKIKFIGGPSNQTMYIAGELHPSFRVSEDHKNPDINPFILNFDSGGNAILTLSKTQIQDCDFEAWSSPTALNFKLVSTAGKWDTLAYAYDAMGNNSIQLESIPQSRELTINLKTMNASGDELEKEINSQGYIAYQITGDHNYKKIVIVHNFSDEPKVVKLTWITPTSKILLDELDASIAGIRESSIKLLDGELLIPPHQSTIVASKN